MTNSESKMDTVQILVKTHCSGKMVEITQTNHLYPFFGIDVMSVFQC